jgi:hypothetical protein
MTMNLDLKYLVRPYTTAKAEKVCIRRHTGSSNVFVGNSCVQYETSDGFRFEVPIEDMGDSFPLEGKAIEFMKWIRGAVKGALNAQVDAAAALLLEDVRADDADDLPF